MSPNWCAFLPFKPTQQHVLKPGTPNTWSVKQDNNTKFSALACSGVPDFNNKPPQQDNLQSLPTPNKDKVVKTLKKNLVFNCDHQFHFWSEHI